MTDPRHPVQSDKPVYLPSSKRASGQVYLVIFLAFIDIPAGLLHRRAGKAH
jgi:hypothetical protein